MAHLGKHAVVIGAGMGGLLAARALSEHYDDVTVLERDALPAGYEPRKGVPQGRHTHGLLARGREVLEALFPGFTAEMLGEGATSADLVNQGLWFNYGRYLAHAPSNMAGIAVSRPMLEGGVRRRLTQMPNVRLRDQCDVLELLFDHAQGRVTGVRVQNRNGANGTDAMIADLVVDSSGRGSPSPTWLSALGFARPEEEQIKINIGYMTRIYRHKPEHLDVLNGGTFAIIAACAPGWRFGGMLPQERERWTVSLGGYLGDQVPSSDSGFLEFARSLPKPEIFNVIKNAEPLSDITPYQFSANQRRHYEALSRFPEGFLVYGDAICSFNPVYGQGMTVACVEALALKECLSKGSENIARRFFRAASKVIDTPWQIAVGSDLQHPRVEGKRTAQMRFINWYIERFFRAAEHDAELATKFLQVANLTQDPSALLSPAIALHVWKGNRQAVRSSGPSVVGQST